MNLLHGSVLLLTCLTNSAIANYQCLCNYHTELKVYGQPNATGAKLGYMYEFDCKPIYTKGSTIKDWKAIHFEKQVSWFVNSYQFSFSCSVKLRTI